MRQGRLPCCLSIRVASNDANVVALVSRVGTLPDAKAFNGNGLRRWNRKRTSASHKKDFWTMRKNALPTPSMWICWCGCPVLSFQLSWDSLWVQNSPCLGPQFRPLKVQLDKQILDEWILIDRLSILPPIFTPESSRQSWRSLIVPCQFRYFLGSPEDFEVTLGGHTGLCKMG